MASKYADITQTGPQTGNEIRKENQSIFEGISNPAPYRSYRDFIYEGPEMSPIQQQNSSDYWGNSRYDDESFNEAQWQQLYENPNEFRAQNQGALSKWGAGLAKGVGLAATTFLDGTIGLLYGVADAATSGDYSRIWDNEVSNALQDFNEKMEVWLPNYRTQEEQNREWWQNLGTANFWADGVLKNLGFTVGAYYSGAAWTKGLKALGWVKKATSAQVVGSLLSGLNEGRIEANHGQREFLTLQNQMIDDARERRAMEIAKNDATTDEEKIIELQDLDNDTAALRQDALERAHKMGLTTLIGNTILLSIDNMWQFGKLYGRGFTNAKGLANRIEAGAMREGIEDVVEDGVLKYTPKVTSKGRKIARGLSNGLVEGNEEMAQAFIQSYAGHRRSYDSPDAYYEALTDPDAKLKTKGILSSLAEGFNDSYGSGDRWEEFAVGAFTGLLGMPTFGKVANSDANTWIGKGRTIGISGGVVGEYRSATQAEREAKEATDVMNKYMDKLRTQANYFAQSQSFTDAMDGFAAESNNFEYKNASNNDDFAAISRFARTGRLNDLKEMVRQDFENMSDEQLVDIAMNTTPNVSVDENGMVSTTDDNNQTMVGGWRNTDGSLMSDTEEGRQQMREELVKKRDKILREIDQYEKSVETVRAVGNNSLTEDQVNELAWLDWKVKMFNDRYSSLKEENSKFLTMLSVEAHDYLNSLDESDNSEKGKRVRSIVHGLSSYLDALSSSKTAIQLGSYVAGNPQLQALLEDQFIEELSGVEHSEYTKYMSNLQDLAKIGKAAIQFDNRYKEFIENPINLIKNRQKIDSKKQKVAEAAKKEDTRSAVRGASIPEMVHAADIGEMSLEEINEMFPSDTEIQDKVEKAKGIIESDKKVKEYLSEDDSIDEQTLSDALKLLENSKGIATEEEQLLDLERESFNDPNILYSPNDPTIQDLPTQEELQYVLTERLDNAKSALSKAMSQLLDEHSSVAEATASPNPIKPVAETVADDTSSESTGRDEVDAVKPINLQEKAPDSPTTIAKNRIMQEVEGTSTIHDDIRNSYENNLSELIDLTYSLKDEGLSLQDTFELVQTSVMWNILANLNSQTGPAYIKWLSELYSSKTKSAEEEVNQVSLEEVEASYDTTADEFESQVTGIIQAQDNGKLGEVLPDQYKYWKPTITELPIHPSRGSVTPFYKIASKMIKSDFTPRFTPQQIRRIEAVGKYLERVGAFNRVNSGIGTQAGDKVMFKIDKALNEEAGEPVILITDSNGDVIGDIMSMNDPTFSNQIGLRAFVDRVLAEYREANEPDYFTSQESSTIDKHMIGKVAFMSDDIISKGLYSSLTSLYTNDNGVVEPFFIGLAMSDGPQAKMIMTPGRTKAQGQSENDRNIIPALSAKKGQPFLLLATGDKKGRNRYIPVPILMPRFNEINHDSKMYKAISSVLSEIPNGNNSTAIQTINKLQELLAIPEIHINYSGDNVRIHVKTREMEQQVQIYNGSKNDDTLVSSILYSLNMMRAPLQVSRKYINTDFQGVSYNEMIGELAKVNIRKGYNHTISDWFTIKPLNVDGKPIKTSSPRSIGVNNNEVKPAQLTTFNVNNDQVTVERGSNAVYINGVLQTGDVLKYLAFRDCVHAGDVTSIRQTEVGLFNPVTMSFVEAPESNVVRKLGSDLVKPTTITSLYSQEQIADISVDPTIKGLAGTNPRTFKIRLQKPSFTPQEVLSQLKGELSNIYSKQKQAVLQNIISGNYKSDYSRHGWTMEMIEELLNSNEAATTFIIAHEKSHQSHLQQDSAAETYNVRVELTEDKKDGFMSPKALDIETRATLDALNEVEAMKPKSSVRRFAETYSGYFEGGGASIENDYNITPNDNDSLQVISDFENALMSNQLTDSISRKFLETLKKHNPTQYAKDKVIFSGQSTTNSATEDTSISTSSRPLESTQQSIDLNAYPISLDELMTLYKKELWNDSNVSDNYNSSEYYPALVNAIQALDGAEHDLSSPGYVLEKRRQLYEFAKSTSSEPYSKKILALFDKAKKNNVQQLEEDPDSKAKKLGLLADPICSKMWESLPISVKQELVSKNIIVAKQLLNKLRLNYDVKTKTFKVQPESIIGISNGNPPMYRVSEAVNNSYDLEKEIKWLKKVLPQFSDAERLHLVSNITKVGSNTIVWGMFNKGIIYLNSSNNSRGTTYHEAFHAVVNTLLTEEETEQLYSLAKEKWGNLGALELEERLAEDFREYTEYEQYNDAKGFKSELIKFWRKLSRMVRNLFGKETALNNLYFRINRGKLSNRSARLTQATRLQDAELHDIKSRAIQDGTFMKAPNGNLTNLTERQWLQVRTQNFLNWFGDWINNPENASKVVDGNGEPLVVYRGEKKENNIKKDITFYTTDKNYANTYGSTQSYFLNIRNIRFMKSIDFDTLSGQMLGDEIALEENPNYRMPDGYIGHDTKDEFKNSNGIEYVALNPNQIKSATDNNGEFSQLNDDIRYRVADSISELDRLQSEYSALEYELEDAYTKLSKEITSAYSHIAPRYKNTYDRATNKKGLAIQDPYSTTSYYSKEEAARVQSSLAPTLGHVFMDTTSIDSTRNYRVMVARKQPSLEEAALSNNTINEISEAMISNLRSQDELRHIIDIERSIEYDRLNADEQMAIIDAGITREQYEELSIDEKFNMLHCYTRFN